jgi:prolipoprotein diacylglyceryltransferase
MVYPTPLWEAIAGIVVFIILWSIRKKLPVAGMLSGIYLVLMGIERFLVEKIRVNTTYHIGDYHITQAEIISTVSVLAGLFIIYYFNKHKNRFAYSKMRETAQSPKVA